MPILVLCSVSRKSTLVFPLAGVPVTGLPRSGKKFWKMKNFQVRELHFQSGKFKKNEKKIIEKSGNFKIFLKRC